jgi:hypothetical protein
MALQPPPSPSPQDPMQIQQLIEQLKASGATEDDIKSILSEGGSPAALGRMYDQSAYLRKAATAPDSSRNAFGAIAQGLAGYGAGKADTRFQQDITGLQQADYIRRRKYYDLLGRQKGSISDQPEQVGYSPDQLSRFQQYPNQDYGEF